jgi:hypothetical protein
MANNFSNFRARTLAEQHTDNKNNSEFIDTHASSTTITHTRISEDIKAVLTINQKEGVDEVILFTKPFADSEDNVTVGDYITHEGDIYLTFMEYKLPTKVKNVYKKHKLIECNVTIKVDNISQRGAYIGSLSRFVNMTEESVSGFSLGIEQYKPVVITKNNASLVVGKRFLLGTEAFEIVALDRKSNQGIMYLSLNATTINATTDNLITGTAITPEAAAENETDETTLRQGELKTVSTNLGYVYFDPVVNILSRTLTSVVFEVPFGISELQVDTKDGDGEIVTTVYTVVV